MSKNETRASDDSKELYSAPEMVRMGDALELTAGGPGVVADGSLSKEHWQDVESSLQPSDPTTLADEARERE